MARDDAVGLVDEYGVDEPELLDARGDLFDLGPWVGPRVARVGPQARDRQGLDVQTLMH